jgi:HEAT repeats/Putative zinc-finger
MKCETVQENIILAHYGELPDELAGALEQHLAICEDCRHELSAMQAMEDRLALHPMMEPDPNLLAQARMRLDDALDLIPPGGFFQRLRTNFSIWMGHLQSAPALATLLVGVGFISGTLVNQYEAHKAEVARIQKEAGITKSHPTEGAISNVTSIVQSPNSELVQVNYNRVIPETREGSLDDPQIRELLVKGMGAATSSDIRANSVSLLANECKVGHECIGGGDPKSLRNQLLVAMQYDEDAGVRLKALEGLQRYVGQDPRVRDAIAESLLQDPNAEVRKEAIATLVPVRTDSTVRQVLRKASTGDENAYIRTASYNVLQGASDIQ